MDPIPTENRSSQSDAYLPNASSFGVGAMMKLSVRERVRVLACIFPMVSVWFSREFFAGCSPRSYYRGSVGPHLISLCLFIYSGIGPIPYRKSVFTSWKSIAR